MHIHKRIHMLVTDKHRLNILHTKISCIYCIFISASLKSDLRKLSRTKSCSGVTVFLFSSVNTGAALSISKYQDRRRKCLHLQSNQIWAHRVAPSLCHTVTLWNMATAVKDEKAMCWIVAVCICVWVCIFLLPAATSAWRLGPESASFQLTGHNLPLHFQLPG